MAEWLKAAVSKTVEGLRVLRGFKSHSFLHAHVVQLAEAFGSNPKCCRFESDREYRYTGRVMAYRVDLAICSVVVDEEQKYVETRFPDGSKVPAVPNDDPDSLSMASDLGYGENIWQMTIDHEVSHSWLAFLDGTYSKALWVVAHPEADFGDEVGQEEERVLEFQKKLIASDKRPWDHLRRPFHWYVPVSS